MTPDVPGNLPTIRPGLQPLGSGRRSSSPKVPPPQLRVLIVTEDDDFWRAARTVLHSISDADLVSVEWVDRCSDAECVLARRHYDACVVDTRSVEDGWIAGVDRASRPPLVAMRAGSVDAQRISRALARTGGLPPR